MMAHRCSGLRFAGQPVEPFLLAFRERKTPHFRGADRIVNHSIDFEACLGGFDLIELRAGLGMFGNKERAAVLVGEDRSLEGSDRARLLDDLVLVHSYQRSENWD